MIGTDGKADGKSFEGKHLSTEISNHYKDVATETIPKRSILEVGDAPTGPSLKLPEDSDAPTSTRGRRNDHSAGTRQNSPSLLPQDSPQRKSTSRTSSVSPPGDNSLQTTASSPSPCVDNHFSPSSTGSRVSGPVPSDTGVSYSMTSETSESIFTEPIVEPMIEPTPAARGTCKSPIRGPRTTYKEYNGTIPFLFTDDGEHSDASLLSGGAKPIQINYVKAKGTPSLYCILPQGAEQPRYTVHNLNNDSIEDERLEPLARDPAAQLSVPVPDDTVHTAKQRKSTSTRSEDASITPVFERNKRRHRCRIMCFTALFVILMVSMGSTVIITGGQVSKASQEAQSATPSIRPTQLFSQTPTVRDGDPAESAPCFKALEVNLDGRTIPGIIDAQDLNLTQRSFHRWCATGGIDYPIIYGPTVYYKFAGNGLLTTIRFCGDSRYRLNIYDSCTTGPRAHYDESCVVSVSTFALDCKTISFNTLPGVDNFILVSTSESCTLNNGFGEYEITLSSNDSCERSANMQIDGSTASAFVPLLQASFEGCNSATQAGAWYSVLGTGDSFTFDTCQSTSPTTQLTVYRGGCGEAQQCVVTSEIGYACPEQGSVSWVSEPNERYYIHAYGTGGMFNLSASRSKPYDLCEGAFPLSTKKTQSYQGTTSEATFASDAAILSSSMFTCSNYNGSPGVWYSMTGTNFINVDTCDDEGEAFEPQIILLQGSCDALTCAQLSVSKPCRSGSGTQILCNLVPGEMYYLFVHGNKANETGSFNLTVTTF